MDIIILIIFSISAYLIGAIPFGLLYSLLRGVDIRKVGSKNIGATNVSRQFGFVGGFLPVFLLDLLKGALPVYFSRIFIQGPIPQDIVLVVVGLMAIIGHMFPVYLAFKGGKGVATTLGVFLLIAPFEALIGGIAFLIVLFTARGIALSRMPEPDKKGQRFFKDLQKGVGLSSSIAAVTLPFSTFFLEPNRIVILIITIFIAVLLLIRHRSNLIKTFKGDHS